MTRATRRSGSTASYRCELAQLPGGEVAAEVAVDVADGRFVRVEPGGASAPDGEERLSGLVLPGAANSHSHAFHRALRGRTHGVRGSFWTWREQMYTIAAALDPDAYRELARAVFAEMTLAGFTAVGEFHYLHHRPDGGRYTDPNEMGHILIEAARDAGLRLALLDTCYLAGGIDEGVQGAQRRFSDGDAAAWAARVEDLHRRHGRASDVVIGAAIHSVRAVPRDELPIVAAWAASHRAPLHVHVSEQPAENEACLAAYGVTPTALLADAGVLGERTTAVHATHLDDEDPRLLGASGTSVCLCPTTERDLADGIGPARRLLDAGVGLAVGTDSHAIIDPFEEARAVELHLRLATLERGSITTNELMAALTEGGQASLGFADAGRIEIGARADLVAVDLGSVRTATGGDADPASMVLFAGAAADVTDVVVDGRRVVRNRMHALGDVGRLLTDAISAVA